MKSIFNIYEGLFDDNFGDMAHTIEQVIGGMRAGWTNNFNYYVHNHDLLKNYLNDVCDDSNPISINNIKLKQWYIGVNKDKDRFVIFHSKGLVNRLGELPCDYIEFYKNPSHKTAIIYFHKDSEAEINTLNNFYKIDKKYWKGLENLLSKYIDV